MGNLLRDFVYSLRVLARRPSFTTTAILTLALGLGSAISMFDLIKAVVFVRLPVSEPNNLFRTAILTNQNTLVPTFHFSVYRQARDLSSFSEVLAEADTHLTMNFADHAERVNVALVSNNFFSSLGTAPVMSEAFGVGFLDAEHTSIAMLSYSFWNRAFGSDRNIIHKTILLKGQPYTVVAVLPPHFYGVNIDQTPDLYVPLNDGKTSIFATDDEPDVQILVRLKSGATATQAREEFQALLDRLTKEAQLSDDESAMGFRVVVEPIGRGVSDLRSNFTKSMPLLVAGPLLLLVIVCANVAALLAARSAGRQSEMSIRSALGASPLGIGSLLFTETAVLTSAGCVLGVFLARMCVPILYRLIPIWGQSSIALRMEPDKYSVGFAVMLVVITTFLCGLASLRGLSDYSLTLGSRSLAAVAPRRTLTTFLVGVQLALCLNLAALVWSLSSSYLAAANSETGYDAPHVLQFSMDPGNSGYSDAQIFAQTQAVLSALSTVPGTKAVGAATVAVFQNKELKNSVGVVGQSLGRQDFLNCDMNVVSVNYLNAVGATIESGRNFSDEDLSKKIRAAIVTEAFARRFFPNRNSLGEKFGSASNGVANADYEIVGVASDIEYRSLGQKAEPVFYVLMSQQEELSGPITVYVRTSADPSAIISSVRQRMREVAPNIPMFELRTLFQQARISLWYQQLLVAVSTLFAVVASSAVAIGLFGVFSYNVALRRQEIAIRSALGASPKNIALLIISGVLRLVGTSLLLGLVALLVFRHEFNSFPSQGTTYNILQLLVPMLFITLVAVLASVVPIARALSVEPSRALQSDI